MALFFRIPLLLTACMLAPGLAAAQSAPKLAKDQPIEISSDKLDVHQDQHQAIFTGNVIAVQGTTNMHAAQMTVFYRQSDSKAAGSSKPTAPAAPPPADNAAGQGIYRIESVGAVVFTTPTETAQGDKAIYDVDANTLDLFGRNVTLTQDKNILKGNKVHYDLTTGRSVLTNDGAARDITGETGSKPARVHGLFIPKSSGAK